RGRRLARRPRPRSAVSGRRAGRRRTPARWPDSGHRRWRRRVPACRRSAGGNPLHGRAAVGHSSHHSPRLWAPPRGQRISILRSLIFPSRQQNSITDPMRSHYCGQVSESLDGQEVTVAGWVHRRRDHGGVIFVDLRDHEGLLQVVFDPDDPQLFAEAERLRGEFVIQVTGKVRARPAGTANANLASGKVELLARTLVVLNRSEPLPFQLDEQVGEETRLRFRYIDLRREEMSRRLRLRHRATMAIRQYMDAHGFIDIETPMLTKATPEGARDYLVP